jgi:cyanophycinase-like exopeptidase
LAVATSERLLVLIGSGETAAQMQRGHRMIATRLAAEGGRVDDVRAAIIDTPYGFQSNADELTDGLLDFFSRRVGMHTSVAALRRADLDVVKRETAYARVREADFVFAGPGSPSYALRHWRDTEIPTLFAEKLRTGGAVVLASAAALTMGPVSVPVYEIYKAGEDPFWMPGLDVLATIGINAAVIPHYDNGEGGDHDTRFCFLGETRLLALESQLPDDTFILGIDEHTALMVDLAAAVCFVHGRGGVTVRRAGDSRFIPSGASLPLADLQARTTGTPIEAPAEPPTERAGTRAPALTPATNGAGVAQQLIARERELSRAQHKARMVEPLIDALLEIRRVARAHNDFGTADVIRKRLMELGVEVSDSADGTEYRYDEDVK